MLGKIEPAFPGSNQVRKLDLATVDDETVFNYAKTHGFTVVTQDSDFHELVALHGFPPKVIWLKCGNRPRWYIENLLLHHREIIVAFGADPETGVLEAY